MSAVRWIALLGFAQILGSCGLYTPEMEALYERQADQKLFENTIVNNVKCEITLGVVESLQAYGTGGEHKAIDWLPGWGATVAMKLTVDEKSSLSPGVTFTPPNNAFSLGLAPSGSADATRVEQIAFTYSFQDLLKDYRRHPFSSCSENENGVLVKSDLKIAQFITDKVFIATVPGSTENPGNKSPYTTFSDEITFVAAYGGGITPTWKFTRVTVNPSTLFSATRTNTDDLTITLGPVVVPATKTAPAQLSIEAENIHFANLIGSAVATAIQSRQH